MDIQQIGGRDRLAGPAPLQEYTENDQVFPAGMWRWRVQGDTMILERATATDWSTLTEAFKVSNAGAITLIKNLRFPTSDDSGAVANEVSLGGYDIDSTHRCLSISSEEAVAAETVAADRTLRVRINGATYKMNLRAV
ncbi:hypothetical protein LCGC14_0632080 [marine sediment metagenome]|uniref:Uncharacterized protein n=1 Tax=marine sediment metagenome TaxID=412755 RepID=A0A0F9UA44_9ZZZZ